MGSCARKTKPTSQHKIRLRLSTQAPHLLNAFGLTCYIEIVRGVCEETIRPTTSYPALSLHVKDTTATSIERPRRVNPLPRVNLYFRQRQECAAYWQGGPLSPQAALPCYRWP